MRAKMFAGAAALGLVSTAVLATAEPASAQRWCGPLGCAWGPVGLAADVVGGAVAAVTSPLWAPGYYPGYAYAPAPAYPYGETYAYENYAYSPGYAYNGYPTGGRNDAYCMQRYRSYDPASGTYMGYDGIRHPCP